MDLHQALKTEIVADFQSEGVDFRLVRLQDGKDRNRLRLHAVPNSWSSGGPQTIDHLANIGFQSGPCSLVSGPECYSRELTNEIDADEFSHAFSQSFRQFRGTERHLAYCGIQLPLPEGQGYFFGKPSPRIRARVEALHGDGHRSSGTQILKSSNDEWFEFRMTWLAEPDRGWVTHYAPKHTPMSREMGAAFRSLGLRSFDNCPEFDFNSCSWRFVRFQQDGESRFSLNNQYVHSRFDAHAEHFGPGIQELMAAQAALRSVGLFIYREVADVTAATDIPIQREFNTQVQNADTARSRYKYDVALSFAGIHRSEAETLSAKLQDAGVRVFYDDLYPEQLWGKDLPVYFAEVYGRESRYCVIFVSQEYSERFWTQHERSHAVARAIKDFGEDYILQIRMDDAELAGVSPTQGYLSIRNYNIDLIGELLLKKIKSER